MNTSDWMGKRERGIVSIIVALSLAALMGFAGLVIDLGRLYINKTELQNATDACALAAANELICDTSSTGSCPPEFLDNAEKAGIFVASRNKNDFQGGSVVIAANDVKFHTALGPNESYLSRSQGALPSSKFAMCTAGVSGIIPWFMGVLGAGPQAVTARAVATLAPGQTSCTSAPIGICAKPGQGAPKYGYDTGEWITSVFNQGQANQDDSGLTGNFRWVDFTPNAGGTNEVRNQLTGTDSFCGIRVGDDISEQGVKQGTKSAWNTRFGIYPNGNTSLTPSNIPPDKTGYSYPSKAPGPVIPVGTSAYADYRSKQGNNTPFKSNEYAPTGAAGNIPGNEITSGEHKTFGAERRLTPAPIIQCGSGANSVKILDMACVLMLNPMSNGATGNLYLEWRGLASSATSGCRTSGVPGGTSNTLVPTLVQ